MQAFPEKDGLHKFREWVESPDPNIFGELGTGNKLKKESLKENNDADLMKESVEGDAIKKPFGNGAVKDIFMDKHVSLNNLWFNLYDSVSIFSNILLWHPEKCEQELAYPSIIS